MDFVATPPHCAFCLCPLPPDESVTCRRCETPYCSAECRSNDLSEGCSKRWTEATVDEETGEGVLPPPQSHRSVCADIVIRLRDVDTRGDPERQEELRIDRLLSATTRAATRNEERRRHFGAVAALKQIRLRMQEHREEQQRSRYRCIVS